VRPRVPGYWHDAYHVAATREHYRLRRPGRGGGTVRARGNNAMTGPQLTHGWKMAILKRRLVRHDHLVSLV
jgi:hypothetical protein